jgi:hypothetical protein
MENEIQVTVADFEKLGLLSHHNKVEIDYAVAAMTRYADATKKMTIQLPDGTSTEVSIENEANASRGFFLKRSLINQIIDDLHITNDPDDCLFIGFALSQPLEDDTAQVHLVFQKANFTRHDETMHKILANKDSPLISILSTLPHEHPVASHITPPPGDPNSGHGGVL